jgi:type IV pilus assembly protein PilA
METRFRFRLLQYFFLYCKTKQGFTLLELLAVIVILGVLSAIALPSLLNLDCGGGHTHLSEARNYVGAMNRAQQAYFLENKGKFSNSFDNLGLGIKNQTANYNYSIRATNNATYTYATARHEYFSKNWFDKKRPVYSFVSAVFAVSPLKNTKSQSTSRSEPEFKVILCQAKTPSTTVLPPPTYRNGVLVCDSSTTLIPKN